MIPANAPKFGLIVSQPKSTPLQERTRWSDGIEEYLLNQYGITPDALNGAPAIEVGNQVFQFIDDSNDKAGTAFLSLRRAVLGFMGTDPEHAGNAFKELIAGLIPISGKAVSTVEEIQNKARAWTA